MTRQSLHPNTWLFWTLSAAVSALVIRNPLYSLLVMLAVLVVRSSQTRGLPAKNGRDFVGGRSTFSSVWIVSVMLFPALLNMAFSRVGETALFVVPVVHWPVTFEAFLFGLGAGAQMAAVLAVFMAFGAAVSPATLLRRIPAGLQAAGVAASIALTLAPQARRSFEAVREAQLIRGHTFKGLRDLPPLFVPLVTLSLEGSLGLAEAMTARGWGSESARGPRIRWGLGGAVGLVSGLLMWSYVGGPMKIAGAGLMVAGAILFARGMRSGSQKKKRTSYRPEVWRGRDTLVSALALSVMAVSALAPALIVYYPYPRATWPEFEAVFGCALMLLLAPAFFGGGRDELVREEADGERDFGGAVEATVVHG